MTAKVENHCTGLRTRHISVDAGVHQLYLVRAVLP